MYSDVDRGTWPLRDGEKIKIQKKNTKKIPGKNGLNGGEHVTAAMTLCIRQVVLIYFRIYYNVERFGLEEKIVENVVAAKVLRARWERGVGGPCGRVALWWWGEREKKNRPPCPENAYASTADQTGSAQKDRSCTRLPPPPPVSRRFTTSAAKFCHCTL